MPRYFFNIEGGPYTEQDTGIDLKGPEQARSAAVTWAGELLQDIDGQFWNGPEWQLLVTDEQGATVCALIIKGMTSEP